MVSKLFTPGKIGKLTIKNRFVRSATYMATAASGGKVSDKTLSIYDELAKNNIGLIVSAYMFTNKNGKAAPKQLGIYDDELIDGLKKLVSTVKEHDTTFFVQIAHGGRQVMGGHLRYIDVVAPSAIADKFTQVTPRKMELDDIKICVKDFVSASRRAHDAGFDGVQLHCAHGYLLSLFLSPYANKRTDSYGGTIENRFRIIKEIIIGIQDELGKDYPIIAKMNVSDFVDAEPQLKIEESKIFAKLMAELGVAAIEPSGGLNETVLIGNHSAMRVKIRTEEDEAYFLKEGKIIKQEIGETPVISVGGMRTLAVAERVLNEGMDFVSLSRPLIREPDLITKWKNGTSIKSDCSSCGLCLSTFDGKSVISCVVLKKLAKKKKKNET